MAPDPLQPPPSTASRPDRAAVQSPGSGAAGWLATGALVVIAAWIAFAGGLYTYDDAFITFRMSANLAGGHGFVYNPGEWHLGSTAALFGLILAGAGWLAGPERIPAIAGAISVASMLATACLLPSLAGGAGRDPAGRRAGLAGGLFYLASPLMFVTFGGEMPFLLLLVVLACLAAQRGRANTAAVLAALAALTRPDGVLVVAVVLTDVSIRQRRLAWREGVVAAAVLLPFALLAWHAYGTPLPSTLAAKLAQRDSGLWGSFGRGLVDWLRLFLWDPARPNLGFAPVAPPTLWLWIVFGALAIRRLRACVSLLAWALLFTAAYAALRVPFYHWYAAPAVLALCLAGGAGLCLAIEKVVGLIGADRRSADRDAPIVTAAAVAAALAISLPPLRALPWTSRLNDNVRLYIDTGRWLAAHTATHSRVGYYEIGYIGFYGGRPMIDALGLIDPSLAPAVVAHDFARAFRDRRPDYILEKPGAGLNTFLRERWFADEYRLETELRFGAEALRIHRRVDAAGH